MDDAVFQEEFSHTVLHQQQIFRKTAASGFDTPGEQPGDAEEGVDPQDDTTPEANSESM